MKYLLPKTALIVHNALTDAKLPSSRCPNRGLFMKRIVTVGLTYDLAEDYAITPDDPADRYHEFDNKRIVRSLADAISANGYQVKLLGNFQQLLRRIGEISKRVDLVFNTAEGLNGRNREAQVPILLEYHDIPFVGSDALTMSLTLDKVFTKKILCAEGIPTAPFLTADTALSERQTLPFPLPAIVKPRWEGSSKGITGNARVNSRSALNRQIRRIAARYHQPVLIEKFISGREFTVAIIGNGKTATALPIAEMRAHGGDIGNRVYESRHVFTNDIQYQCPAPIDASLACLITDLALRTYRAVDCKDVGRVDFRVNPQGQPFVLEINPIPALNPQDVFGVVAKTMRWSYSQIIGYIVAATIKRYHLN